MEIRTIHKNHNANRLFNLTAEIRCHNFFEFSRLFVYFENKLNHTLDIQNCRLQNFNPIWTYDIKGSNKNLYFEDIETISFYLMGYTHLPKPKW